MYQIGHTNIHEKDVSRRRYKYMRGEECNRERERKDVSVRVIGILISESRVVIIPENF